MEIDFSNSLQGQIKEKEVRNNNVYLFSANPQRIACQCRNYNDKDLNSQIPLIKQEAYEYDV